MKTLCNIINVLAMVMVLMLGAVYVHGQESGHSHVVESGEHAEADAAMDLSPDSHPSDDRSVHCGAPILGAEAVKLGCSVRVADVIYPDKGITGITELSSGNLRPPRR